jgi:Na+/H+-dicarboxylate symporter
VIIGVVAGTIVGLVAPDLGKSLGVLGELFVKLIKMMIIPVIFCTVVLGIGKIKAAAVGKVGGLAIVYFLVMSTIAVGIGLVVGNIIKPGKRDPRELSTQQCKDIIDELERMQVFYVNIGGGEPTVRPDFWEFMSG